MPLYPACAFDDTSKRGYKNKAKPIKSIKKDKDTPGSHTSADYIVSHEPGLVPQVTRKLTHQRHTGAVVFSDHCTDFIYTHLVKGTSIEETMLSKHAYEIENKAH